MVELISRISRGSRMDQVYIPKKRAGFNVGEYVLIKHISENTKEIERPFFYNINELEPIKIRIIEDIFSIINRRIGYYENVIISGSFLEKGFCFNDIDIILICLNKENLNVLREDIEKIIGIKIHIMQIDMKGLIKGLETDPLYSSILNRFVAKKRMIFNFRTKIDYRILDIHLLKSRDFIVNFDLLNGSEKYYLIMNMIAISLFLEKKKIDREIIEREIKRMLGIEDIKIIKYNMLNKKEALKKYKKFYGFVFSKILEGLKNEPK